MKSLKDAINYVKNNIPYFENTVEENYNSKLKMLVSKDKNEWFKRKVKDLEDFQKYREIKAIMKPILENNKEYK